MSNTSLRVLIITLTLFPKAVLALCTTGGAQAIEVKPAPTSQAKVPAWEAGKHVEFESALLATCKSINSIDKLIEQLKASKAVYWVRNSEKLAPNGPGDTEPYVGVLITPGRSIRIYFAKDTKAVKATRIVNTYF